ncbi:MAG: hypothetical protein V1747_02275 [Candidatus Omnitrophota bacterium]
MLRKVLSVFVICSFMFTSVSYAMPSATGINPTVDNIALKSALDSANTLGSVANLDTVTTVFNTVAAQQLDPKDADLMAAVNAMWKTNLDSIGANADHVFNSGDITIDVSVPGEIKITKGAVTRYIRSTDDGIKLYDQSISGASGKSTDGNEQALKDLLTAESNIINDAAQTAAKKSAALAKLEADLNAGVQAGRVEASLAQEMLDHGRAVVLKLAENMGFIDADNYQVGDALGKEMTIYNGLSDEAFADLFRHEILEGMGKSDKEALEIVMKIDGITDRKDIDAKTVDGKTNQMAATRAEVKAKVEAEAAAQPKTISDLNLSKKYADETMKDEDVKAGVMTEIKDSALPAEQKKAIAEASPKTVATMIRGLITDAIAAIQVKLTAAMDAFYKKYQAMQKVTVEGKNSVISALGKDKTKAATDHTVFGAMQPDGTWLPSKKGAEFILSAKDANIGNQKIVFTGAGNAETQAAIEKTLAKMGAADIFQVVQGKENSAAIGREAGDRLIVIYSDANTIAGSVDGAEYYHVKDLNSPLVNIMAVFVKVINGEGIIAADGSIAIELDSIDKFTPEEYDDMATEYEALIDILIQA